MSESLPSSDEPNIPLKASKFSADILYNILRFSGTKTDDLTWLWTTCREVSHDLKDAADRVFITRHLKRTSLFMDGGMTYDKDIGKISLQSEFSFIHLDPMDRTRALFREKECHVDVKPLLSHALAAKFRKGNLTHRPRIIIQIRHDVNDTLIPDIVPNWEAWELECNWMGMVSEWYTEEKEHRRRVREVLKSNAMETKMRAMRAQVEAGEMSTEDSVFDTLETLCGNYDDTRQVIRAERIARNVHREWEEQGYVPKGNWEDPDEAGYKKLKDVRYMLGWEETYSDEEHE